MVLCYFWYQMVLCYLAEIYLAGNSVGFLISEGLKTSIEIYLDFNGNILKSKPIGYKDIVSSDESFFLILFL